METGIPCLQPLPERIRLPRMNQERPDARGVRFPATAGTRGAASTRRADAVRIERMTAAAFIGAALPEFLAGVDEAAFCPANMFNASADRTSETWCVSATSDRKKRFPGIRRGIGDRMSRRAAWQPWATQRGPLRT
jgi:hypothetical protein